MIEKVGFMQLLISGDNNLGDVFQSGFKKYHSTESVFVKVIDDILLILDSGSTALV